MFITILHRRFWRRVHNYFTQESQLEVVYILHKRFKRRVHNYFTQKV